MAKCFKSKLTALSNFLCDEPCLVGTKGDWLQACYQFCNVDVKERRVKELVQHDHFMYV